VQEKWAIGVLAELVAKDAETARGVAKPGSGLVGGNLIDEKGAQGFVLAVDGTGGNEEGSRFRCYIKLFTGKYTSTMSYRE
jgi:hypothetical protein